MMIRLVTLWDIMQRFDGSDFFCLGVLLGQVDAQEREYQRKPEMARWRGVLSVELKQTFTDVLRGFEQDCRCLSLETSAAFVSELLRRLSEADVLSVDANRDLDTLKEMLTHDNEK